MFKKYLLAWSML